ncbi:NADH-quinone oxidoreductase subunit M [Hamadaea sp.]|uniref:complex I subunit 4 family protein n=1 Tax=Hamadaea sp. TaxID=2024425 RepID=UPI0025C644FD|nr:NADH-quinone oxidoreductase subunit M [Hamadaea sp.]
MSLLTLLLLIPLAGAIAAALLPDRAGRIVATGAAALTFLLSLPLAASRGSGLWHQVRYDWVPSIGVKFALGVDGISYPLVVLTTLLTLLCCAYTVWRSPEDRPSGAKLAALLLIIEVGLLGVFLSLDLVLFFISFEVVLLPMYAVIAGWGGPDRRRAARKFALYTLFGSVLLLIGVLGIGTSAGSFDMDLLSIEPSLPRSTQIGLFVVLAVAFAVKAPLWPLHTWLPAAHTEAPTVGSVILAGVLLKMGTYGLIRVGLGILPEGAKAVAPVLGVLAVVAIIVGSLVCLAQRELKRLIAYSSVGHMGFVLLGIAAGAASGGFASSTGVQAALLGNIAHGVITGLLFFLAGAIKDRTHTGDLHELGGLRETSPALAGILGFAALASLGLPGLAGFWGEAFAVVAAVQLGGGWLWLAVVAAVGGALTAAYLLRLLRRVTHGPAAPAVTGIPAVTMAEGLAWAPLVLLALAIGLVPALVNGYVLESMPKVIELVAR